jgi:hypothetical protein
VAYPYFLSFTILMSIIMLNLFTAVIIESFEAQQEQDVSIRWYQVKQLESATSAPTRLPIAAMVAGREGCLLAPRTVEEL